VRINYTFITTLCFALIFLGTCPSFSECLPGNLEPTLEIDIPEEGTIWPFFDSEHFSFSGRVFDDDGEIVSLMYRRCREDRFESVYFSDGKFDFRSELRAGENRITLCATDNEGCTVCLQRSIWGEEPVSTVKKKWGSLKAIYQ
jgi:hypothetical protein